MQLANLDNEIIFKKAFTNKIVFKAFVKDVLGIDFEVDVIETEKRFKPKIGYIDFELDIYAESVDKRICVEIQRVEYDHHFDRFLNYFLMLIAEQQRSAKECSIDQTVYMIVLLTEKYTIREKDGKAIKDELLFININPQTITGEIRDLYGHQLVCLNPNHPHESTPPQIREWLNLVYQSIHNSKNYVLNTTNEGIKKAAELISFDNLTPEERTASKNKEANKITIAKIEKNARDEERAMAVMGFYDLGISIENIAKALKTTEAEITQIIAEINNENSNNQNKTKLIDFDNLTPEERTASKNKEANKITIAKIEKNARDEERTIAVQKELELIAQLFKNNVPLGVIAKSSNKTEAEITQIIAENKQ